MKTLNICAALLFSIFAINFSFAQGTTKKETIKVWGNCSMCKTTIEKAAKKGGATTANWNEESKELKVSFASNKTSSDKIQQSIAKFGYDTQGFTADDKVYNKLHGCCKYDRKAADASIQSAVTDTLKAYSCPMHPDVTSDGPGKCSKCGMDLTKSKKEQMKMEAMKMYSCSMHPDVKSNAPGKCSQCGMDLTKSKKEEMKMGAMYSCPMHPDMKSDKAGKCSQCGMNLAKTDKTDHLKMGAMYSCPMHPEVKSDKPGKCSQCGMDLAKSKKEQMKMEVMKMYSCPMHADVTSDKAGKCSKCGMALKEKKEIHKH
jgi:hypothetical protein